MKSAKPSLSKLVEPAGSLTAQMVRHVASLMLPWSANAVMS